MAIRSVISDSLLYLTYSNYQGPNGATKGSVWKYNIPDSSWKNISPSSGSYGFSGISLYPKNPNIIIVSTLDRWSPKDEVYLTTNGGASWTPRIANAIFDHSYAPYTSGVNPHWLAALVLDPFIPVKQCLEPAMEFGHATIYLHLILHGILKIRISKKLFQCKS